MKELFYDFFGYNKSLFITINNSINNEKILILLKYFSYLFDIEMFAFYYFIITCTVFVYLKSIKNNENRYEKFKCISDKMFVIGISYTIFGFLYAFLKFYVNLPRPYCSLGLDEFRTIADTASARCLSSFPSSHAGISFMIAYFLFYYNVWVYIRVYKVDDMEDYIENQAEDHKTNCSANYEGNYITNHAAWNFFIKTGLIFAVFVVCLSRISLAMHYPSDIFYGIILSYLVIKISQGICRNKYFTNFSQYVLNIIYSAILK